MADLDQVTRSSETAGLAQSTILKGTTRVAPLAHWFQNAYGKLVESRGGPIVANFDHRCVGKSEGIGPELTRLCYPDRTGIGADDQTGWGGYPWLDELGGIVLRAVWADAQPFLLAARILGRPEFPGKTGRLFTQGHYLATQPANIVDLPLLDLPACLIAEPPTAIVPLEKISVPTRDFPLPDDWWRTVCDLLAPLLAGNSVVIVDCRQSPPAVYDKFMLCLACLPPAVRWRIPLGCGMCVVNPEQVALGHGMKALAGGVQLGAIDQNLDRMPPTQAVSVYLQWLRERTSAATRLSEIAHAVEEGLPGLANWDGLGAPGTSALDWKQAIASLHEHLNEEIQLAEVERSLQSKDAPLATQYAFRHYRGRFLNMLCRRLEADPTHGPAAELLAQTIGWQQEWQSLAQSGASGLVRALAMLMGHLPVDPRVLMHTRSCPFSAAVTSQAVEVVWSALRQAASIRRLDGWFPVLRCGLKRDTPSWLSQLSADQARGRLLFWMLCHLLLNRSLSDEEQNDVRGMTSLRAAADLIGHEAPKPFGLFMILSFLTDREQAADMNGFVQQTASDLCQRAEAAQLHADAWALQGHLDHLLGNPPASLTRFAGLQESQRSALAIRAALLFSSLTEDRRFGENRGMPLRELLLAFWRFVPEQSKSQFGSALTDGLSGLLSKVLLNAEWRTRPADLDVEDAVRSRVLPVALRSDPEAVRRALECLNGPNHAWLCSPLRELALDPQATGTRAAFPELQWLSELAKQDAADLIGLTADQAGNVAALVQEEPPRELPGSITNLMQLHTYLASKPRRLPASADIQPRVLTEALQHLLANDAKELNFLHKGLLQLSKNVAQTSPWRLLWFHLSPDDLDTVKYTELEEQALAGIDSPARRLRWVLIYGPPPRCYLTQPEWLSDELLMETPLDVKQIERLLSLGEKHRVEAFGKVLLHWLIRDTSENERFNLTVLEQAIKPWYRVWSRPRLSHRSELAKAAWELGYSGSRNKFRDVWLAVKPPLPWQM